MPTVRRRGKRYNVQVRIKEGGQIVHQESATFDTHAAAMLWGLKLEETIGREGVQARLAKTLTVEHLLDAYLKSRAFTKAPGRGVMHSIATLQHSPLGQCKVNAMTSVQVIDWCLERHRAGNSPATVLHHLSYLSSAFKAGKALTGVEVNSEAVTQAIDQLKRMRVALPSVRRERRVSDEEIEAMCADMAGFTVDTPTFIRLAVALPRRREELLTMQWKHISADRKTLRLLDTKSPSGYRDEVIPLPPAAWEIINALPRTDERVMPYRPESVSTAFQRCVKRLGFEDLRLHDLRHEGISRLFEAGLSIEEVALISGHTSWSTLRRYTHLKPQTVTEKLSASAQRSKETAAQPSGA